MKIGVHAVRRYKKRIGCRTASKKRICDLINKEIERNTVRKMYNKMTGQYRITTSKFIAVCEKGMVVTILPLEEQEQMSG
jgi:hypothetical protein